MSDTSEDWKAKALGYAYSSDHYKELLDQANKRIEESNEEILDFMAIDIQSDVEKDELRDRIEELEGAIRKYYTEKVQNEGYTTHGEETLWKILNKEGN